MMRALYSLILYLALPFILLRLRLRARKAPAYALRWRERFGFVPVLSSEKPVVWLHTVSVGEFLAALPLIRQLQQDEVQLVITTTTPTGSERVKAALGDSVYHVYAPYDLPDCLARFMRRVQPSLMLMMETELWPNTLAACHKRVVPAVLINGRLSARSARGYQKFSALTRPMLAQLTAAGIQHRDDADRFAALGLPTERIRVTGNIKFDIQLADALRQRAAQLKEEWTDHGKRLVWIAASTHTGEDEIILDAFSRLKNANTAAAQSLLLVLVPRHPERFNNVAELCEKRGFAIVRRSQGVTPAAADILVGDTMGELQLLFGASDIAFVGGSLVPNGGHNMLEPAAWQLPLNSGPHVFNFAESARLLQANNALVLAEDAAALAADTLQLIEAPALRLQRGEAALAVVENNRGALERTLQLIRQFIVKQKD
ncbi:lipid IV(A) 3-deoxy-D-manno-octulosonic acid transferase [Cellvibrio polysaccharolyticus]|uniref:3-deoxy-D-manno-octulosonic acid transferase n=1 Tax=Cellvibrio polysaccharolyticus TaxID=2082724 RepID=A0A928V8L3_9GAMM|nr:lipid IV(A) 3-deoxy-D-manno-octulosonic acid transferase [Cellvibrio polysaccharolyticus]MBE8718712.1 3-deoxy-D-manno-octulosonic acid transferase [Cellvibrio polysaccharolyticus]